MLTSETDINEQALGKLIGVSRVTIWKWRRLGMPVKSQGCPGRQNRYDLTEVRTWLESRGLGCYLSVNNQPNNRIGNIRDELARRTSSPEAHTGALARVRSLAEQAAITIEADQFAQVESALRAALAAVPVERRAEVTMPESVWDALTADFRRIEDDGTSTAQLTEMSDADVEYMGDFWYDVASGHIKA